MSVHAERDPDKWSIDRSALDVRRWTDNAPDSPVTLLVRHPSAPYAARTRVDDLSAIQRNALAYLHAVNDAGCELPQAWLAALDAGDDPHFRWLAPGDAGDAARPIGSRYARGLRKTKPPRALILFASQVVDHVVLGSEIGLRIVIRFGTIVDEDMEIRIDGCSASLPSGRFQTERLFWAEEGRSHAFFEFLSTSRPAIGRALGLQPESVFFRGLRLQESKSVELRGRGLGNSHERLGVPYEFILDITPGEELKEAAFGTARKFPLVSCAVGETRVLRCDPASSRPLPFDFRRRRPTRPDDALDAFREPEPEPVPLDIAHRVRVFQSRFVNGDDPTAGPKTVPLPDNLPIRSNSFTAVSALRNLRQLFERFELYGIDPDDYFWLADLPLQAYYRSGISPGPGKDGQTVNGRVLPAGWPPDQVFPPTRSDRPALQVHLALGNLSTRDRKPWDRTHPTQAEPLGFAADPRWIWHELAHVLMMAALGELEFRFAHSVGDALAAIVADPGSRLAGHPDGRGYTFPWVFAPRRHDRCVRHGWGWSGTIGKGLRDLPDSERLRRKGYWTEQILSTTLFLLYRSLGGDTTNPAMDPPEPDLAVRNPASDYTVYLIMTALQLLADPRAVPARRPEQLAAALSEADEITVTCPTTDGQGNIIEHVGGCATKVVRWAFEAQGMYPQAAGVIHDGVGMPPPVDIFVPDRRPADLSWGTTTVDYGTGGYVPVSLDWGTIGTGAVNVVPPRWFARDDAISRANGGITVRVANRGQNPALGVDVTLWFRDWPEGQPPPVWDPAQWQAVPLNQPADIPPGGERMFGPFALPAAGTRLLLLAQADCPADQSILNPILGLACRLGPTPLTQLVPGDNNLGLAVLPP